jgi:fucose permease
MLLIIIYIAFISLGLPDSLLGSGWPVMHLAFNVPTHYAGLISVIVTGGTVISSLVSTKAVCKFGTAKVVVVSVSLTALALFGFSLSQQFVFLLLFAFPLGLGAGSIDAALNNFVALHYKASHMNFLHACWGVGATLSPLVMFYWLSKNSAWQLGYRTVSIIQLCIAVMMFASFPLWKKAEGQAAERSGKSAGGENTGSSNKREAPGIIETISRKGVKAAVLAFFAYCAFETIAGLWGPTFLVTIKGLTPEAAASRIASY